MHCRAALGDSSGSSLNSPQAKEVVLSAITTAGKEAGLKVVSKPLVSLHGFRPLACIQY